MNESLTGRARRLCEAAIDAPWSVRRDQTPSGDKWVVSDGNGMGVAQCGDDEASARFIAASRELVPAHVARIEALGVAHETRENEEG